jgi:hypothetical protein
MELIALAPDVILAQGDATLAPLLQATQTVPMMFTIVADPVGAGYIAPSIKRAAVLRDPALTSGTALFAAIQAVAPRRPRSAWHDADEIELSGHRRAAAGPAISASDELREGGGSGLR